MMIGATKEYAPILQNIHHWLFITGFMESGSQSASPLHRHPHRFADFVGIVIALLTLTLPLVTIAHYSSSAKVAQPVRSVPTNVRN